MGATMATGRIFSVRVNLDDLGASPPRRLSDADRSAWLTGFRGSTIYDDAGCQIGRVFTLAEVCADLARGS
jgi:hypothetical protein